MKIWIGGEIESHIINLFRPVRNWVEQNLNEYISRYTFELEVEKIRMCFVMRKDFVTEYCKYNEKKKSTSILLNIDSDEFINSSEFEQRKIIFDNVISAINWLDRKNEEDLSPLKKLLREFKEKYIIPLFEKELLEEIQQKFSLMREKDINIDKVLEWSFFFLSEEKEDLSKLLPEMEGHSYNVEYDLIQNENTYWRLTLSKRENLKEEKLNRRNIYFKELSTYCQVYYDGWDVQLS